VPKSHQIRSGGIELWKSDEECDELGNGSGCRETDAADVLTLQIQVGGIRLCCTLSCPLNSDGSESQPRLSVIFPAVESIVHMRENMRRKWRQLQASEVVGCVRASGDFAKFWLQCDYISRSQTAPTPMAMSTARPLRPRPR